MPKLTEEEEWKKSMLESQKDLVRVHREGLARVNPDALPDLYEAAKYAMTDLEELDEDEGVAYELLRDAVAKAERRDAS